MPTAEIANVTKPRSVFRTVLEWAGFGAVAGAVLPVLALGGMLAERLLHVARGGGGESAAWGEPVFYMVVAAMPAAAGGAAIGALLGALRHLVAGRASKAQRPTPGP